MENNQKVCPQCDGRGWYVIPTQPDGEPEQVQCNCYEQGRTDVIREINSGEWKVEIKNPS
jgi:hypothetical protein